MKRPCKRSQTRILAEAAAAAEDQIVVTLHQLARQQPHRAGQLRAMAESARKYAMRGRQRLMRQPGGGTRRGHDLAPAASRPGPGPASTPEPAASIMTPGGPFPVANPAPSPWQATPDALAVLRDEETALLTVWQAHTSVRCRCPDDGSCEARQALEDAVSKFQELLARESGASIP